MSRDSHCLVQYRLRQSVESFGRNLMTAVERDETVRYLQLSEMRLLGGNQIRTRKFIVPSDDYRERTAPGEASGAFSPKLGRQQTGKENDLIRLHSSS